MYNQDLFDTPSAYFASANGYDGFRSYFDTVFNPRDYSRIYVLKGGPGTGKSSLMKRLLNDTYFSNFTREAIFCSSDPNSLDGVIISSDKGSVAVIDGTAPHECDAKIPGARDEIINLGQMWNKGALISNAEEITRLNEEKKRHYKAAYYYLSFAGKYSTVREEIIDNAYKKNDVPTIEELLADISERVQYSEEKTRLISAFGKNGYMRQPNSFNNAKRKVYVKGIYGSDNLFLKRLLELSRYRGLSFVRFPSPLSDKITEAIYYTDEDFVIISGESGETCIDTGKFLQKKAIEENKGILDFLAAGEEDVLRRSANEFSIVSGIHFALEKIYTQAMNFGEIDNVFLNMKTEISNII